MAGFLVYVGMGSGPWVAPWVVAQVCGRKKI